MKFYQTYLDVLKNAGEISHAWFTTFNIDPELVERYLLPPLGKMQAGEMRTTEDYEELNTELENKNIRIWYDFRALNSVSPKRTVIPLIPVDPATFGSELFHPKVIFIKGDCGSWLITGSANLSIAAWRDNRESVIVRPIIYRSQALAIITFFEMLDPQAKDLAGWAQTLPNGNPDWDFFHSFLTGNIFEYLSPSETLRIWSPYFSKHLSGFLKNVSSYGFDSIDLVPDMSPQGKVRITDKELHDLAELSHISFKVITGDDLDVSNHAKVWLSDHKIAVGSWNCTYKGTGINPLQFNIEAGIIADISEADRHWLQNTLSDLPYSKLESSTGEELEREWEEVLEKFIYCCRVSANWETFTYGFEHQDRGQNFNITLPDAPGKRIPVMSVNGKSFRDGFEKVLASKTFHVYDQTGREVYRGYIEENHTSARPVMGYLTVSDLIDSLLRDPSGSTGSSKVVYDLDNEPGEGGQAEAFLNYQGTHSYYRMFVAFQLLSDRLEQLHGNEDELNQLLFRLPGSLLQIRLLITRMEASSEDEKLFYWFIAQEFNRCLRQIKDRQPSVQLDIIETSELLKEMKPTRKDKAFLKLLSKQFAYDL